MSAVDRWDRLASVLLWTAVLFAALTAYSIYERETIYGVAMYGGATVVLFGLWFWRDNARD